MRQIEDAPSRPEPSLTYLRPPAMAAVWVTLVGLATGFYSAGGQATLSDGIGFGCSLAIAMAAAVIATFGFGGRRRWAIELTLSVLLVSLILALLIGYFFWFDPTFARRKMNLWQFQGAQSHAANWAGQIARYHGPLGGMVGAALGTTTGLLTILARRKPGLAIGAALAILFAFASDFGRQFAIDKVTWLGWILRYYFVPHSYSDDEISTTAMIFGAIVGSVIAGVALHATGDRKRTAIMPGS
jgi:hypothetical protein